MASLTRRVSRNANNPTKMNRRTIKTIDKQYYIKVNVIRCNRDMSELNGGQRAVMALVVPLVWVLGYMIYRVGKREMNGENNEYARWGVWYWLVAGCVCGKWLFHVIPNATLHTIIGPSEYHVSGVLSFGILLGLIAMVIFQEVTRVWHGNPNYQSSATVESQEDMLDKKNMTQRTNVYIGTTHDFGSDYMNGIDKVKDQVKRQRIASILLVCMFYLSGIEGLFTCFWQDKSLASTWTLVMMTWLMRLMDSVIVYCSMIHGMFHTQDPDEPQR